MSDEELRGEQRVGLAGGKFGAIVDENVLQREGVIGCNADATVFTEVDAAVIEQDVLATVVVIATVTS